MAGWADDPELLETFRAEVEERTASLQAGLLALESHPSPRQVVTDLFRDVHTVKGSARMLGLADVLRVAHAAEDLLGALRDGRLTVRRDLVDLLLAASDAILGGLPGAALPAPGDHLDALVAAMQQASAGEQPVTVPQWSPAAVTAGSPDDRGSDEARPGASDSVRVTTGKVHELLDIVGEAELDARRLRHTSAGIERIASEHTTCLRALRDAVAASPMATPASDALTRLAVMDDRLVAAARQLREVTEPGEERLAEMRDAAMGLAMVPLRRITGSLPRVVREVAAAAGKDVELRLEGEDVELDKQVLDGVSDAVKHLVVNAVDHGCEPPPARAAAGKPPTATVTVAARAAGGTVVIEVSDDGSGIDEDAVRLAAVDRGLLSPGSPATGPTLLDVLFRPAFSTAARVTETSGRGVGLDAVRRAVDGLGGSVVIRTSTGAGTTFVVTLPVTVGVLRCLLARVGDERYALPIGGVVESLSLRTEPVHELAGRPVVVRHGATLPLLDLGDALDVAGPRDPVAAVVVRHGGRQLAWAVDALEGERELVVKDLGGFVGRPVGTVGATIDGDGRVVCLLDLRELVEPNGSVAATPNGSVVAAPNGSVVATPNGSTVAAPGGRPDGRDQAGRARVLVVEDSLGVRELERAILEAAGYDVVTAIDGTEGAARLEGDPADLVLSDVEMPGMDGYALTRTIRRTRGWEQVPVVIMTSRGSEDDQRAGLDAGASAYLRKSEFDQDQLVETVRRLVGR